jgi:hypothetical protein
VVVGGNGEHVLFVVFVTDGEDIWFFWGVNHNEFGNFCKKRNTEQSTFFLRTFYSIKLKR